MSPIEQRKDNLDNARVKRARNRRVLTILGCMVVVITAVALMVPAISMTQDVAQRDAGIYLDTQATQVLGAEAAADAAESQSGAVGAGASTNSDATANADDAAGRAATSQNAASAQSQSSDSANSSDSSQASVNSGESADVAAQKHASASAEAASANPAQSFREELKDGYGNVTIVVAVEAPEGAFPAGTTMKTRELPETDVRDKVEEAIEKSGNSKDDIAAMTAIDIVFQDADGNEIEPAKKVEVKITSQKVREIENPVLVHVVDKEKPAQAAKADDAEIVNKVEVVNEDDNDKTIGTEDTLKFKTTEFSPYVIVEMKTIAADVITAAGESYTITVDYGEDAHIPEGARLEARELLPETDEYNEHLQASAAQLGLASTDDITFARFFDIQILDADGQKVEPKAATQVKIAYNDSLDLADDAELDVVHFADEGTEVIQNVTIAANNTEVAFSQSSFSVTGTIITGNGNPAQQNHYVVVVKHNGEYYAVQSDGSLDKVTYNAANNTVTTNFPITWQYRSAQDNPDYEPYVLRMEAEAAEFDGYELPIRYSYRYIDPNTDAGIREEQIFSPTNVERLAWDCECRYEESSHTIHGTYMVQQGYNYSYPNNGKYITVVQQNGKLRIAGNASESEAAEVYLASINTVPAPYGTSNAVNHIDISVTGSVDVTVPLAYGKYYYYDANNQIQVLDVSAAHPYISKAPEVPVAIKKEDMLDASLYAYKKNNDGTITKLDNMFYITGYSDNGKSDGDTSKADQVRIEGSFKVSYTDVPGRNGDANSRAARLATPVYYSLSAPKTVTVPLYYSEQVGDETVYRPLYAQNPEETGEEPLITSATVTLSADFTYWDFQNNTCPAAVRNLGGNWRSGDIPDGRDDDKFHSGSGMDFVVTGGTSGGSSRAVEITKIVVDENGNRIKSANAGTNTFQIYRSDTATSDSVRDLNVGSATTNPLIYEGYTPQHTKEVVVGADGLGATYDYDVADGMYYISEDPSSIQEQIIDTSGQTWDYKETYILTEYAWRNHQNDNYMHVSPTYSENTDSYGSVPEILGDHPSYDETQTFTNDFLEFYVYNVYESPKVDVPVTKTWADFDEDDLYDWTATFKLQWAPLYPGEARPTATFQDVTPLQEMTITKDQMKDAESQAASLVDRTFKDLPKYGTDKNGNTFRYQYSLEETSYAVINKTTGVVLYSWDEENGYNTPEEDDHYQPFYPHDAGEVESGNTEEENAADANYYIQVSNAKKNVREKEYIDVTFDKQWDSTFDERDDSYWAEFELKRFVHTEHRDLSHMSDSDRAANPVTITIKDGYGQVVHTFKAQPNVGLYLAGNFAPHDSAKSVTFTSDKPVRLASESHVSTITATAEGSNMSNALVRSPEFFVTEGTVFTIASGEENLVVGQPAKVLDTAAGTSPMPDRTFSQTIRLDNSNGWHADLEDLVRSETHAGDDDDQENVVFYEYYLVEKDGNPKGYAQYFRAQYDEASGVWVPTELESGDSDHQIETNDHIVAVNGPANRLVVKKLWRGVPDTTGFPGVTFTLYQTWADGNEGWVYENPNTGARYEHIELKGNSLEWICPEVLPTTRPDGDRSRAVKYYVVEDVRNGSQTKDGVTTSWKFYYYLNSKGQQTNAGHQGYFAALNGLDLEADGGTITICNEMNAYMQLDIQKQYFMLKEDGSWDNVTATSDIKKNAILGFQVIRAIKAPDGKWLDDSGNETDDPVWMDYGEEMLCGYDENGNTVVHRGENDIFWLHDAGGDWHFRIEDNQGDATNVNAGGAGLPSYGFYIRNGEDIPVEYWYSVRETNVYKNLEKDPYPEWDWFSSITPVNAHGPNGQTMEAFPKAFHGQDAQRIANFQASDLIVDKDWIGEPTAKQVYVKIWRTSGNGEPEDFTAVISDDIRNNKNWQMYVNDPAQIDVNRNCLILDLDKDDGTASIKVNRALLGALSETGEYHYYIQEVGYKTQTGEYRTNVNAKYRPLYDKWEGSATEGNWTNAPVGMNDYASNTITIGAKGENKLKVINRSSPSTSYTVTKAFHGPQSSTGGQSSVTGKYPTDGSKQVVVELQQRYRYEKLADESGTGEGEIEWVSADNENWVRADSEAAATTWIVGWQGAESASPTSVTLPLEKPAGSTLSDEAWYGSAAAWSYTWEGLDLKKVIAEDANPENNKIAQLYYRAVEVSTPEWFNSVIAADEQDGHKAIDDDSQTTAGILTEKNTVTNERNDCDLELNKAWTGLGEGVTWPEGYTIDYQLIQHLHLAIATMSSGEDGHIVPTYSTGKIFKSRNMTTANTGASEADSVHPQATGINVGAPADGSTVIANISGLPVYGFYTVTAADVAEAADAGVYLTEGVTYPVVYTYSAKETAVKKNGNPVGFKPQTVDAERVPASSSDDGPSDDQDGEGETGDEGDQSVVDANAIEYTATLTNDLVDVTVEKVWNGITPGKDESATIELLRFKKNIEPEPETTFTYTVAITGSDDALASDGTVTAVVYDANDTEVGRYTLKKNDWSHGFTLDVGGTYHATFEGDGEVLESSISPATAEGITEAITTSLAATVKPVASGSVKVVVTGNPSGLWMNQLKQYINGNAQDSTAQNWNPSNFNGNGGETAVLSGLIPGAEYRFQIGAAPNSIDGAAYSNGFVSFTASDGLTTIAMDYSSGGDDDQKTTFDSVQISTTGSIQGQSGTLWDNRNSLSIGQQYSYSLQLKDIQSPYSFNDAIIEVTGADYVITNRSAWGSTGGQINMSVIPTSSDPVVIRVVYNEIETTSFNSAATTLSKGAISNQDGNLVSTNPLIIGQEYEYNLAVQGLDAGELNRYSISITGATYRIGTVSDYYNGQSGNIQMFVTPTSPAQPIVVHVSFGDAANGANSVQRLRSFTGRVLAAAPPLRANAAITWTNDTAGLPEGANPETYEVVDTVTFSGTTWSKTWSELPKYSEDGKEYVYYAYETAYTGVDGATAMETTYSTDENGNLVVTNTPTMPDRGNLKVEKEVFYGSELDPDADALSFKVGIFTDANGMTRVTGQEDKTITVTDGKGEVTFTDLESGTYYIFEIVDNAPVTTNGATAIIDGSTYTVTYDNNASTVSAGNTATAKVTNTKAQHELNVLKYDKTDTTKAKTLDGAEFKLNKLVATTDTSGSTEVSYDTSFTEVTLTTANGGTVKTPALARGYYEIKESKAPDGYLLNQDSTFYIRVKGSGVQLVIREDGKHPDEWQTATESGEVTFVANGSTYTAQVANTPGKPLPHTGGSGTTIFTITGVLLMAFGGVILVRMRKSTEKGGR